MSGEPQLFVGDIDPNNIVEGYLGNSYFVSTLKALAQNPKHIKRLFDVKKATKDGQYIVNFCLNGENYKVEIDDYIPYCDKMKKPAFSKSKENELWVMLIEKAWAKVSGNYENSIKGLCCESFRALTGAPVDYINHSHLSEVWEKLSEAFNQGFVMCALAEKEKFIESKFDENDLFSAYAYSITKIHEIQQDDGRTRLVRISDPGNQKWLSMFKDSSKVLEEELKQNKASKSSEDSVLISIEDYLCYFRTSLICQANSHMNSSSLRCKQNFGDHNVVRISLSESEKVSFTISQFNQKFVGRTQNKEPAFMRTIFARERDNSEEESKDFPYEYIDGKAGHEENITISHDCQPGDYLVFVEIQGNMQKQN